VPTQNVKFSNVEPIHVLGFTKTLPLPIFFPLSPPASLCRIQKPNQIFVATSFCLSCYSSVTSGGLSIGVDSGFNPHPVSVFFLPHGGDISSFVHLLPPNSTVDKNAPSPLVVFCSNSNANATVNNVLFVAAFKSIRSIPYLLNDCSFSLPLGCARSDTSFHAAILLQASPANS